MVEISEQDVTPVVEIDGRVIIGYEPMMYDRILEEGNSKRVKDTDAEAEINLE